ncbi:hypothetical protein FHR20_001222 [Sphingomonas leidyi]|uniref:Transcriptional regulator-like domain-containing protein n=1 Tax=Sphingomonas leidyi TaxID=68569 RepID=A0A7X5UZ05_9SPHN|nr:DUF6499 domain-containing protein [Sphingomonas leidyi]NIJ64291.1 hypothetical protein [Sphingomonas leidyi]
MQSVSDWRSPKTAEDFAHLDYADFAQEFLRRNPDYCREYHDLMRRLIDQPVDEDIEMARLGHRWGLSFRVCSRSFRHRCARLMGARCRQRDSRSGRRSG